jgi:hypothetical protein
MPIVLKSGNLNLLEPSGPIQAYIGVAFPFMPCFFKVIHLTNSTNLYIADTFIVQILLLVSASSSVFVDATLILQEGLQDL